MKQFGPLHGITIVDLTRVLAGPFCTMVLADLGATVIKVEIPEHGDDSRHFGPFLGETSAYFMSLNRGKQSIALDLKQPKDRENFEALLSNADVLIENFRPGTMKRLGYDWISLHNMYPELIMASISGFGQTGPMSNEPAYDLVIQAMGGLMSITGQPEGPPTRVGTSIGDIASAMFASNGILAALYHRSQTCEGSYVDISMLDCQVALLENAIARTHTQGNPPQPLGARHPSITPFDAFQTKDGPIVIACGNDKLFQKLCDVLRREELKLDVRFVTNAARTEHQEDLKVELESTLQTNHKEHWLEQLKLEGIPSGPIQNVKEVMEHPQVKARNMIVTCQDPVEGAVPMAGNPIKIEGFPDPGKRAPAPRLDQDREKLIGES
ncbi:MAG: CoA transferase [Deltaproteobacteria bacterium]|nr:MAG: CoA transferase [Deltaproteobacteria bacterium]